VVLIDGCFLRCHGRILEGLLGAEKLVQFDALKVYKRYTDIFDIDGVPEPERMATAQQVADHVLSQLGQADEANEVGESCCTESQPQGCCGS
jgi:hypothetical protein